MLKKSAWDPEVTNWRNLMHKKSLIAACGNDCTHCPRFIASANNDADELMAVAGLWYRCGFRATVVSAEEIKCYGCKTSPSCRYEIRECVNDHQIENCGQCKDYPCGRIKQAFKRTALFAQVLRDKLSPTEFQSFSDAFWCKRDNLDASARLIK